MSNEGKGTVGALFAAVFATAAPPAGFKRSNGDQETQVGLRLSEDSAVDPLMQRYFLIGLQRRRLYLLQ